MGNRGVITTEDKNIGIYLHWNGSRESVEGFLAYCDLKGYRQPEIDDYGWARLCQVIGNFFGGTTSVGINRYERLDTDNWDNGVFIIKNWEIVGREFQRYSDIHQDNMEEFLKFVNERMPENERIPEKEIEDYAKKWNEKHLNEKINEYLIDEYNYEEGDINDDR